MPNVKTIELTGTETAVRFNENYPYYFITNKSDSDIYVSMYPDITPKAEGVYTVSAGGTERIGSGYPFNKFYVLGVGEAYIRGEQIAIPPSFKQGKKGGESNAYISSLIQYSVVSADGEILTAENIYTEE